jgi:oligopeptide/dipeptide ABC transporter ATP-binding protein
VTVSVAPRSGDEKPHGAPEPLVELQHLTKHFAVKQGVFSTGKGVVHAVEDVSLTVNKGETLGIVGESGCGKSTTARLMVRLLEPTSGMVRFEGEDISRLSQRQLRPLRREMQIIFQDPYSSLNPRKTIGQIIGEPFAIHHTEKDIKSKVQELIARVGLSPEHYNRYPHEFSGGQRQRIGVARAFALRPKLIVCDEPVSALDVSVQAQILNLLKSLQQEFDLTYVFISHDLSVIRQISDRIAVMYLGKVVEIGESELLYEHPRHPYTAALLSAVPRPETNKESVRRRIVLSGDVPSPVDPPRACVFHPRCPRFEPGRCDVWTPPLRAFEGDHEAACHYPVERWPMTAEELAHHDLAAASDRPASPIPAAGLPFAPPDPGDVVFASPAIVKRVKWSYGKSGFLMLTPDRLTFVTGNPETSWQVALSEITRLKRPWYGLGSYVTCEVAGAYYAFAFGKRRRALVPSVSSASDLAIRFGGGLVRAAGFAGNIWAIGYIRRAARVGGEWFTRLGGKAR